MPDYDRHFYEDLATTALPSARRIVPIVLELVAVRSVIDVGCGDGSWLAVFRELGVADVFGVDGDWVDTDQLKIPLDSFAPRRLDEALAIGRRSDLAISLEVAEHLWPDRAAGFVGELCGLAPVVLFSAAIPHQGGHNHFNEQWPGYWAELFAAREYRPVDVLRLRIWDDPGVTWWYKQNIMLFASDAGLTAHPRLAAARKHAPAVPPPLVHPDKYRELVRLTQPSFGRWLKMAMAAFRRSVRKRAGA